MAKVERVLEPYHIAMYSLTGVSLIFLVDVFDPFNLPKLALLVIFTSACIGCFLGNKKQKLDEIWFKRTVFEKLYLLLLLFFPWILFISGIVATESKYHAFWGNTGRHLGLIYFSCVIILSIIVVSSRTQKLEITISTVIRATTIPFIAYCTVQTFDLDPVPWQNPFDPMIGTLGNPNFSSGFLGSLFGFYMFRLFFQFKEKKYFSIDSILFILVLFLTLRNSSTQGRLLLIISIVLLSVFTIRRMLQAFLTKCLLIITLTLCSSFSLWSFLGRGPLGNLLYQDTIAIRLEYWTVGIKSMLANPLFGLGVDSYIEGFRKYRSKEFANERSLAVVSDNAHNSLIQVGATFGVISFLIIILILGITTFRAFEILLKESATKSQVSVAVMFILLFIQSLFSIEQIGLGIWLWILSALLMNPQFMNQSHEESKLKFDVSKNNYGRNFGRELSFIFGVIALLIVIPKIQEDSNFGKLLISEINSNTNPSTIDAKVEKFTGFTLEEPKRAIGIANAYFLANWNQKAEEILQRVRLQDPHNWESRDALALAFGSLNKTESAIEVRIEMESLDPNHWINKFELASLYLKLGDSEKARLYYQKVVEISPKSIEGKKSMDWLANS